MYSHVDESFGHARHAGWQYPAPNRGNPVDTLRAVPPRTPGSATLTREHLLRCIARHNAYLFQYVRRNSRRKNRLADTIVRTVESRRHLGPAGLRTATALHVAARYFSMRGSSSVTTALINTSWGL